MHEQADRGKDGTNERREQDHMVEVMRRAASLDCQPTLLKL